MVMSGDEKRNDGEKENEKEEKKGRRKNRKEKKPFSGIFASHNHPMEIIMIRIVLFCFLFFSRDQKKSLFFLFFLLSLNLKPSAFVFILTIDKTRDLAQHNDHSSFWKTQLKIEKKCHFENPSSSCKKKPQVHFPLVKAKEF